MRMPSGSSRSQQRVPELLFRRRLERYRAPLRPALLRIRVEQSFRQRQIRYPVLDQNLCLYSWCDELPTL